jgi:DHA1 family multidrug resistance protein-like MFS transporter
VSDSGATAANWQRNVWTLALIVFVAFVGFQFSSPFMPLYVRELGVTDPGLIAIWSGLLAAITPAVSGLLGPWFGRLADRFGRKAMLIRSLVAFIVIIWWMGLVTSVEQLFLARLLQGFFAGFTPMVMALASTAAPRQKMSSAIGIVQSAQLLSVAVGPAVGGYVAAHFGIRYAFFATAGLCALALIGLMALFHEGTGEGPDRSRSRASRASLRAVLRYPHFPAVVALLLVAQFLDRGLSLLIPLRVTHMPGVEAGAAISGLILSVAAVAATISANLAARLARGIPTARLAIAGLLAGGVLCVVMALPRGWVALLLLRALAGLCLGGVITLAYSLGALIVPGDNRGAAFGWLALGVQFGSAASPLATGALAALSLPGAFVFCGLLAWAGAGLVVFRARALLSRYEAD